ncbi:zinc finger, CCHC-type containing protein [Tanacetum coccineum]|uniref:Zinc finger, CCHC-type containing protein n=1 Tax=Tanacetum coccineum TaxID=301880 RepID=A0ABQ5GGP4_9ASTR
MEVTSFLVVIYAVTSLAKCKVIFSKNDSEIVKDGKVIGHANMHLIQSLASKELVRNLPKLKFDQHFCDACKIGKQAYASHKSKNVVTTTRYLELLHMDLFGLSVVQSYEGNLYTLVIVDDYSSHEGYRNTIELPVGNNVVPLRSDTIRLVLTRCSFHGLRSEDPNQHLKDFLKLVDSLNLDGANRERMRLRLFQFSLRDQASNWLKRLPAGSISTWEDLTTRFLA